MSTLTAEEIEEINDAGDAIMKGIDLDIPMDGLDSLDEMISRLKCHRRFQQEGPLKAKVSNRFIEISWITSQSV